LLAVAASLAVAAPATAAPAVDGEFPLPAGEEVGSNNEIVQGPDGNMWVTTMGNAVVRITPDGTVEGPFDTVNSVTGITVGPDENLWVTTALGVREIPPGDPANGTSHNDAGLENASSITTGLDGNMWIARADTLVRFDPADPVATQTPTSVPGLSPKGMTTGSDGLIWIADQGGNVISATPEDSPTVTAYAVGSGPQDVAAGPSGQVAYASSNENEVGLIPSGGPAAQQIPVGTSDPFGAVFGQDGAYWIARSSTDDLVRLTTDGQTTTLGGFSDAANVGPRKIATGPNNTLWVTLDEQEAVARVSGLEPPGSGLETTIDKRPKKKLETERKARAKFKFSASDPAATFECKLKRKRAKGGRNALRAARFRACESPKKYKLKPGKYKFSVRAVLGAVKDATPAKAKFKVVRER
jgi:streptogramin lyase